MQISWENEAKGESLDVDFRNDMGVSECRTNQQFSSAMSRE
jgi:hypothetical protein